jgi:hypothetical protein
MPRSDAPTDVPTDAPIPPDRLHAATPAAALAPRFAPPLDAAVLARVALASVGREYPYRPDVWLESDSDLALPRAQHPLFHTSYDWHSCVHMHWSLLRLLRRYRAALDAGSAEAICAHFDARLTVEAVRGETALFDRPGRATFERPYGWAWLLALQAELARLGESARHWQDALAPLALRLARALADHLPRLDWPVRAGTHANSAFACVLALDYARTCAHPALERAIELAAHRWFGHDRRYPAHYEPGGEDFLSPGLTEALLMQQVLDDCDFADWWPAFAPSGNALAQWLAPVRVSDMQDARIVHLHGLNLARAWCWRTLHPQLPQPLQGPAAQAAAAHWRSSSAQAVEGAYVSTHWLASFALLAVSGVDGGAAAAGAGGAAASAPSP